MGGVLCAGNVLVDILTRPVPEIRWDATMWVEDVVQGLGGNGGSTSFSIARAGARVRLMGLTGRDPFGDYCRRTLEGAGVDLSLLGYANEATSCSVVLVRPDGARALLHRPGAGREAFPEPLRFEAEMVDGCEHFHLANPFGLPLLRSHAGETLRNARQAGLTTSLDTGWDARGEWMTVAGPCFEHLDLLFVNRDEARMLAGTEDPDRAGAFFRDRGARVVVVKLGARGCLVLGPAGRFESPAFDVPVVDTTGAGDTFAGAFLAATQHGAGLEEAADYANAAGALSIQAMGGTAGVLARDRTLEWMRGARRRGAMC